MKLRVCVIGMGPIGNRHGDIYSADPLSELAGVCDIVPERADAAARRLGVPAFYNAVEMLETLRPDLCSVTTSGVENGSDHFLPTMQALDAGCHVLCEKPICNEIEKAEKMVARAKEKGLCFGVDMNHRFTPAAELAKHWQNEGRLGDLLFINMSMWIMNPNESSPYFHIKSLHPHTVDVMRHFCGDIEAVQCFATKAPGRKIWSTATFNMRFKNGVVGTLNFLGFSKSPFTVRDAEFLAGVGNRIGTAIEKATLYEELQRREEARRELLGKVITAQEEERKRVARELHDETGQALTALIMSLAAVEDILPSDLPEVKRRLAELKSLTNRTLEDIRKLMFDLRPTVLDDLGLIPALRWYIKSCSARSGIDIDMETRGFRGRLPSQIETVVFRIVQEAITNIMKYAEARRVRVVLEVKDSSLYALVQDNGKGFNVEQVFRSRDKGLGLLGMQERANLLGGTFSVQSSTRRGTKLTVRIPLVA